MIVSHDSIRLWCIKFGAIYRLWHVNFFSSESGVLEFMAPNNNPKVGAGDSIASAKSRIVSAQPMTLS